MPKTQISALLLKCFVVALIYICGYLRNGKRILVAFSLVFKFYFSNNMATNITLATKFTKLIAIYLTPCYFLIFKFVYSI